MRCSHFSSKKLRAFPASRDKHSVRDERILCNSPFCLSTCPLFSFSFRSLYLPSSSLPFLRLYLPLAHPSSLFVHSIGVSLRDPSVHSDCQWFTFVLDVIYPNTSTSHCYERLREKRLFNRGYWELDTKPTHSRLNKFHLVDRATWKRSAVQPCLTGDATIRSFVSEILRRFN